MERVYLHRAAKASRATRQPTGRDVEAEFNGNEPDDVLPRNHPSDGLTTSMLTNNQIDGIESSYGTMPGPRADADDLNTIVQEALPMRTKPVKRKRRGAEGADRIQDDTTGPKPRKRRAPRSRSHPGSTLQDPIVIEDDDGAGTGTRRANPITATGLGVKENSDCHICFDTFLNANGHLRPTPHFNDECQGIACVACWDSYVRSVDFKSCNPLKCMFPNCIRSLDSDEIKTLVSEEAFIE